MRSVWLTLFLAFSIVFSGISQITGFEYFIDSDPGIGQATSFSIGNGISVSGEFKVPLDALEKGFHYLGVRTFDSDGRVSQTYLHPFYLLSIQSGQISEVEYFVDEDPGHGKGTKIPFELDDNGYINYSIPLSTVNEGHRLLGIRSKNTVGVWSQTKHWFFYNRNGHIPTHIVKIEYRFTGDGAPETTFIHELQEPSSHIDLERLVSLAELEPEKTYDIYVAVIDEHGIKSNEVSASFTVSRSIMIDKIEITDISCAGEENGIVSILMSGNDENLEYSLNNTSFQDGNRFEGLAPGDYTVYVRDKSDTENMTEAEFTINPAANEVPTTPAITIQGEDGISQELALVSSSATGNQWFKDGEPIPGATGQTIQITESGTYQVVVTGNGGCSASSEMVAITSSPEVKTLSIRLYPNPADNSTNIRFGREAHVDRIAVYSANGVVVREFSWRMAASDIHIDLEGLSAGTYFIQVEGIGLMERLRLIKK